MYFANYIIVFNVNKGNKTSNSFILIRKNLGQAYGLLLITSQLALHDLQNVSSSNSPCCTYATAYLTKMLADNLCLIIS